MREVPIIESQADTHAGHHVPTGAPACVCEPSTTAATPPPGRFSAHQPALPATVRSVRRGLQAWAAERDLDDELAAAIVQVTDEAVTNVVEHAVGQRPCTVEVLADTRGCGGGVAVLVRDDGTWRPQPTDRGFRGRGLTMIARLAERATVTASAAGTTVRMCWADPSPN